MGLYQSLDFMEVNGFLDGFSKTQEGITAMPVIKYIYRLDSVHTGHFYIGQTNNLKSRFYWHIKTISTLALNQSSPGAGPFHKTIAPLLVPLYDQWQHKKKKKPEIDFFVRRSISAYIYAICGDQLTADVVENHYLKLNRGNQLCLNSN